jgi:hypothetical protein
MKSLKLIKPYFIENRFIILLGIVCPIIVDFLQLLIPRVIKWVVDDLTAFSIEAMNLLVYASYIAGIAVMIALFDVQGSSLLLTHLYLFTSINCTQEINILISLSILKVSLSAMYLINTIKSEA